MLAVKLCLNIRVSNRSQSFRDVMSALFTFPLGDTRQGVWPYYSKLLVFWWCSLPDVLYANAPRAVFRFREEVVVQRKCVFPWWFFCWFGKVCSRIQSFLSCQSIWKGCWSTCEHLGEGVEGWGGGTVVCLKRRNLRLDLPNWIADVTTHI